VGIVDEDIARVREAADIVAVISQHTQLRRVGQRWTGLCPFHTEKSPSFSVNGVEGLYYCFGCQQRGDVITFVREIEHLDFVGAVEWLANKFNVTIRYTDVEEGASRKRITRLRGVMERAVEWYHDRLLSGEDAGAARAYLRSRGFDREMVATYRIGWAPDSWDALARALKVPTDDLVECGLGFLNKIQKQQDFFRARVLFPIFDDQGRPIAFGGRKLPGTEGPKYQNSRENTLYNKSRALYGLNWAKTDVVTASQVIVCEGYTDVIGFFRAGLPRAVATCGTALTEDHVRSLKRFTSNIVLAYDADSAGQNAAARVYEWEQRHEISVSVISMPAGSDPDELSREDPQKLVSAVEDAKPFLGFRVSRVLESADLASPEGRARAAEAAIDVVREHPSAFVRDQYVVEIAGFCRVDEAVLRQRLSAPASTTAAPKSAGGPRGVDTHQSEDDGRSELSSTRPARVVRESSELEAVRLLIQNLEGIGPFLSPHLFGDPTVRAAYEAFAVTGTVADAVELVGAQEGDLLARLAVEQSEADVVDVVSRLAAEAARRTISVLEHDAKASVNPLEYAPLLGWLKLHVDNLTGDEATVETLDELLAWLDEHGADFR
jgi:DNA primase